MNDRKVLIVIGSLDVGGAEKHVVQMAMLLDKAGWDVSLFLISFTGQLAKSFLDSGVKLVGPGAMKTEPTKNKNKIVRIFRSVWHVLSLSRIIIKKKPQIIHCFLPDSCG